MILEIIVAALAAAVLVLLAVNYFMRQRDVLYRARQNHSSYVK